MRVKAVGKNLANTGKRFRGYTIDNGTSIRQ